MKFSKQLLLIGDEPIPPAPNVNFTNRIPYESRFPNLKVWFRVFSISMLLVGWLSLTRPLLGQEPTTDGQVSPSIKTKDVTESPVQTAALLKKKQQALVVGVTMLAGVLSLALFLFLWMLWWSRRTRNILREPLPEAGRGDELWYLKAKQDVQEATERLSASDKKTPLP